MKEISDPFFVPTTINGEDTVPSGIGFDFLGAHYRFLDHLEESDVLQIVNHVKGAFPEIAKSWDRPTPSFDTGGLTTLRLSR
jgi:hypothetical protein